MPNNDYLIREFEEVVHNMKKEVDNSDESVVFKNKMRLKKLKDSLKIIKKYAKVIEKGEDIEHIYGIGKGTVLRINQILKDKNTKHINSNSSFSNELEDVYGIGRKYALKLIKNGITTVEQLKKTDISSLPYQIKMGLKYHKLYKKNIPRREIKIIKDYVNEISSKLDRSIIITVCGSYRRCNDTSNDIDLLIVNKNQKTRDMLYDNSSLDLLIDKLYELEFLIDKLTYGPTKYSGFCKFKSFPIRRIDIRYVAYNSYYTALLYFTGPVEFNIKIRNIAIKKKYKLNEYGIYSYTEKNNIIKMVVKSEKDIFDYLGIDYVEPSDR